MFDKIYKWIFYFSYKKHFSKNQFLIRLGLYVQHVQSSIYARKMRAAVLWAAISALYLWWELEVVKDAKTLTFWGLQFGEIKQEDILLLLLVGTGYYTTRLVFLALKAGGFVNPFFLIRPLYCRKKLDKYNMADNAKDPADLDAQLCCWLSYLLNVYRYALDSNVTTETSTLIPGFSQKKKSDKVKKEKKKEKRKEPGYMTCTEQVRFMVDNPTLGLLENFIFPVLVIPGFCVFVVYRLAAGL